MASNTILPLKELRLLEELADSKTGQEIHKISLENLIIIESKEVLEKKKSYMVEEC